MIKWAAIALMLVTACKTRKSVTVNAGSGETKVAAGSAVSIDAAGSMDAAPSAVPAECEHAFIVVNISAKGILMNVGGANCTAKRKGMDLDVAWLEKELAPFSSLPCNPTVQLYALDPVKYQDLITVMDIAVKAGLPHVAISPPGHTISGISNGTATDHCQIVAIDNGMPWPEQGSGAGRPRVGKRVAPPESGSAALANAPVIVVTRDDISVGGTSVGKVNEVVKRQWGQWTINELVAALPKPTSETAPVVLQADKDTSATVIDIIIENVNSAGYGNVLFAVKN